MLRLTLRTLLAYLDDTLEPAQAKLIGQKVAESEQARELMERIKQVTRRRRITTPPPSSKMDPNTIAEYLDNEVSPEQAAEVEQIALASDVHLAEVAACHQILTLILGEPASVPPEVNQRMYGLVKGPEAIPFRKPVKGGARSEPESVSESREVDETLRLGLPALGRKLGWRTPLLLLGGGLAAALVLAVAIWQVLRLPGDGKTDTLAQADVKKKDGDKGNGVDDKGASDKKEMDKKETDKKEKEKETPKDKKEEDKTEDKPAPKKKEVETPKAEPFSIPDVAYGPPSDKQAPIGRLLQPEAKETGILMQQMMDKSWRRVAGKNLKVPDPVYSSRPLLALPASKSVVQTNRGLKVTLWSNAPMTWPPATIPFRYESGAELHFHNDLDLELTLRRGRLVLENTEERPVVVRLRVENPLYAGQNEFFDLALDAKGTEVIVDHWSYFPFTEPFYKNPKEAKRAGPTVEVGILVMSGNTLVKHGDVTFSMNAPPGRAVVAWKSTEGLRGPFDLKQAPDMAPKFEPAILKARDEVAAKLVNQDIDVVLAESVASPTPAVRRYAVLSMEALDDIAGLVEALNQEKLGDLRLSAHEALRNWISLSRDNDYKLYDLLKTRYKAKEAGDIMELLHYFSAEQLKRPERYEVLIDNLDNSNLVIRELSHWHLVSLVPQGRKIRYSAAMDSIQRQQAQAEWRLLIPPGQLPPAPQKAK